MAPRVTITEVTVSTEPDPRRRRRAPAASLLMTRLARASSRYLAASLEPTGIKAPEFAVLSYLSAVGPLPQGALGSGLRIDPSNLVALIDRLEAAGLVVRGRDPEDRRRHRLALTEAGAEKLGEAERAVADAEQALLEPLSRAEQVQLIGLLDRLAQHSCSHSRMGC
ncbi:MarR family transcriptional regulator [Thermoleophilia bacterium SCSIO 60948]|nr:MarR family transcriptional regulator [Thermoleophilia bacterium SCSIO 60948]